MKRVKLKKNGFQFGNVLTISFAHLVHDIYSSFLAPILPLLIEKLSISYAMVGFLSLIQRLPSLANPFVGLMADRLALRYLLILSPVITAITMSLLGVVLGNILQGIAIGPEYLYTGNGFWEFLNPYAILVGITSLALFMMHGAIFLLLKTEGKLYERIKVLLNKGASI